MGNKKKKKKLQRFKKWLKKIEFSKILSMCVVFAIAAISFYSIFSYYSLVKLAISAGSMVLPDASLPITCISTILGALLTYCLYQFGLKNSRNKYNIDSDGIPFLDKMKELYDDAKKISDEIDQINGEDENGSFYNS